jgi:cystathionine gamma-lyase
MSWGDGTRAAHAGLASSPGSPLAPQPVAASAFHLGGADFYGRAENPTWRALEDAIGSLDGGECVLFASGMAAISTLMRAVLRTGDTVVVPSDGYYLARQYVHSEMDVAVREVPTAAAWSAADVAGARLVLLETPSNPGLDVCDIAAISALAHAAGALVAVDNTTATPLGQQPLALGADVVVASDTKALAGHSDVVLGHVSTQDATLAAALRRSRTAGGAIPGPFEAWLAHRGLGTLDLRLTRQAANAAAVHAALSGHESVSGLRWPGASSDPAHALASRQMRRFNGVVTFVLPSAEAVGDMISRSRLIVPATSFGGLHTTADRRAQWGDSVPSGLVRLSCGVEDSADLVADLLAALA